MTPPLGIASLRAAFGQRGKLGFAWRDSPIARRYIGLGARDRRAVNIGLAAAVAMLLYAGVYQPIAEYRTAAIANYLTHQSRLQWMQAHEARARRSGTQTAPSSSGQSLLTLVDSTAKAFDLRLTRYQPDSDGGVTVVIEGQPFNPILKWTERLAAEHGLRVATASIHGQEEPGLVNAHFRIR